MNISRRQFNKVALTLATIMISGSNGVAKDAKGKVVSYTYPNGITRTFNTNLFWIENGRAYLTAEAMSAIDVSSNRSGYKKAHSYSAIKNASPERRKQMLSFNARVYTKHTTDQHGGDCGMYAAFMSVAEAKAAGKDAEKTRCVIIDHYKKKFGTDWQKDVIPCSVIDIFKIVHKAEGLPPPKL